LAVILPVILRALLLPVISSTYGNDYQIFELFGFCQSLVLLIIGYLEIKRRPIASLKQAIFVILPLLVSFLYLTMIVEYSQKIYDYYCYENAAKCILAGTNPYLKYGGLAYTYPPFVAQFMSIIYSLIRWGTVLVGRTATEEVLWGLVFYFYQCAQYLSVILAYELSRRFATMVGLSRWDSLLLVTVLFLFNNSLIRTLKHDQVNLYLLNAILISMISLPKRQLFSGLALSLGGHIKLYPLLFGLPLILMKKWKAVLGIVVGFGVVIVIQTNLGRDWELWKQFVGFLPYLPTPAAFRNNSIYSLMSNLVRFSGLPRPTTDFLVAIATLSILVWFGTRFFQREKICNKDTSLFHDQEAYRVFGNMVDCSALMLLLSPLVWEHHYILAIPLAIWAFAQQGSKNPWLVGVGTFMMFVLPTFDVFPLSYHRISGLLLLLWLTSPKWNDPRRLDSQAAQVGTLSSGLGRTVSFPPLP
jgi:hypothetical protein